MELSNVLIMYFKPDFKYGNSMAVFKKFAESFEEENRRLFTKYMVNWVANCKLIFLALLVVVLIAGTPTIKIASIIAMILSIGIYFVSLHPIITKLDKNDDITPKGYSVKLKYTILLFIFVFAAALAAYFLTK